MQPIKVLTVDDHPLLREGIVGVLEDEADIDVVAEASNGGEALERFRHYNPDVTLMDLQMPDVSGLDSIIAIMKEFPGARIIVVTTYSGDVQIVRALKAGAVGYLLKSTLRKELTNAIRTVHTGRRYIPSEIAALIAEHTPEYALSEREIEVLKCIAEGHANKEVGARLFISEDTVKSHMRSILLKLAANDRTHAVTIALRRGIFSI
jgi:DNA-binding NarL/FixJ family response regulator